MKSKIFLFLSFIIFLIVGFFTYSNYVSSKNIYLEKIDSKLKASALTLDLHLGKDFVDIYTKDSPMDKKTHYETMLQLSEYAKNVHLEYIYILVKDNEKVYFLIASEQDKAIKENTYDPFYMEYNASDLIKNGFKDNHSFVDEYTDKYGEFRSFFITQKSPKGRIYMIGSDMDVAEVHKNINLILMKSLLMGFVALILGNIVAYVFSKFTCKYLLKD